MQPDPWELRLLDEAVGPLRGGIEVDRPLVLPAEDQPAVRVPAQREQGYRAALEAAGVAFDPALVLATGYGDTDLQDTARALLTLPDRPTAIFAANDVSAIATIDVALTLGLDVPAELSVVGFDNVPESALCRPPLTTVEQPLQLMGQRAAEMLVAMLAGDQPADLHLHLPTRLVVRDSTAAPAVTIAPA